MLNIILLFLALIFSPINAKSGYDEYTTIDKIGNWIIERKYISDDENVICRASIPRQYPWFGDRIRISKKGDLVVPAEYFKEYMLIPERLLEVTIALDNCNSNFIYE